MATLKCSSPSEKKSGAFTDTLVLAVPQEGFAEDTVLINQYHQFASSYLFMDAEKAMFYAKFVLRLSQKHQWAKGKVLAYNLLSTYYLLDGSYDILRGLSNETIMLSRQLHMPFYTAHAQRFLAESYGEYRQWDSARVNYNRAISTFKALGADSSQAMCLENLANSFREKKLYDESMPYYDEAYALFDKIESDWGRATVLQSKGYLHVLQKQYAPAEKYFDQSLALFTRIQNRYGQVNVLNDIANNYCLQGQFDKGIATSTAALDSSVLYHSVQQTNWALLSLSRAYKGKGMHDKALDYMEKVIFNRRMVHTDNVQREYTMYQLTYENERKDSEIQEKAIETQRLQTSIFATVSILVLILAIILWLNNKKLRRKNAEIHEAMIQGQTIERKRVAAELHDNLGGTLASLNWYLYGIDKSLLPPEEQKIYQSVHQMVGAAYRELRSLSHNLMPQELEEHGLVIALERLVSQMNENKNIEFVFNSRLHNRVQSRIEVELYSIILELTTNIIKHSGSTKASISLYESMKNIYVIVSDNGSGVVEPMRQGMGLKNIKNRVSGLRGRLTIHSEAQTGIKVEIEIPKPAA
ncbi:tetratricopeptide repeat protein [Dyadobacter sandarakinus]|uniref:histidine kinase n=2 Tax=Dyadobacter sandarakinus TaxID=2747268 RepID=A0ABX7IDL1_9BACT|nr:tetratricopeptide repeat protein [Dyadobacter sandarakinus]